MIRRGARTVWAWIQSQPGHLLVAVVLGCCLLWPAPHLDRLRPPNELVRLYATRAVVDDHTVAIDAQVQRYGRLADSARRDGHLYSDKAPGLSLMAVPVYALLRLFAAAEELSSATLLRLLRTVLIVIPSAVWLMVLGTWLLDLGVSRRVTIGVQIAYALGTPAFAYCLKLVGHQAAGWMVGMALAFAWRGRGGKGSWRYLAGLCAGAAAITEYPTLPLLFFAGAYALVKAPRPWRGVLHFGAGALLPLALGALYHTLAYGGPFTTGYDYVVNPVFRSVHENGLVGVGWPKPEALVALTIGAQRGLLILSPWLLLAVIGLWDLWSPRRWLVALLVGNIGGLLWVATGFGYWLGGWSVGPRHLVSALPAMTVLAALGWHRATERWPRLEPVIRGAVLAGCVACSATALTLPGFPEELTAPLFELALPLLARLQFSYSLGTSIGFSSTVGMLPALGLVAGSVLWMAAGQPEIRSWLALSRSPLSSSRRWDKVRRNLWQLGVAGWVALFFFGAMGLAVPRPSPEAVFRVAWLTQTVWEPKDVDRQLDPRPARWEEAHRARMRRDLKPHHLGALGAVDAYRGYARAALHDYALAAYGAPAGER